MSRQDQSVDGGEAYQAGRDLTVNRGLTTDQMGQIMVALAGQLSSYLNEAEQKAANRYRELREDILKEFARSDSRGNREAFSEPDFQFVLKEAHESYARSGAPELREELVRLLVERSAQSTRSRAALVLNEAIKIVGSLTEDEFSILAVTFAIKWVTVTADNLESVAVRYELMLRPFVANLTTDNFSFEYLESIGCATIERVADHYPLAEHMHRRYSDLRKGMTQQQLWEELKSKCSSFQEVENVWDKGLYASTMLTLLGKALAHSALDSKNVMGAPLGIWVR